jgi:hypothetical protein
VPRPPAVPATQLAELLPETQQAMRKRRSTTTKLEVQLVDSEATRQLGIRISERLAMRLDIAALKGRLGKSQLGTGRAIVEAALERFLEQIEAA